MPKLHLGLLGSTRGTHLKHLHQAIQQGQISAEIAVVISDQKNAYILQRAHDLNIPHYYVPTQNPRSHSDQIIHQHLKDHQVDYVFLIGYMKIISDWLCQRWQSRMFNIHPSLLPHYAGKRDLDVHRSVLENEDPTTGCTIHEVSEIVDAGKIVLQKTCDVDPKDTEQSLKSKVQSLEKQALIEIIQNLGG